MTIEINAPTLPESVPDGTIATWYKDVGDTVARDELLVDIETDKVVIEVVSPADGILQEILKPSGETIVSNELIASISSTQGVAQDSSTAATVAAADPARNGDGAVEAGVMISPAARKLMAENQLATATISGSGKDGRITKEDVLNYLATDPQPDAPAPVAAATQLMPALSSPEGRREERVPMSRLRARVAARLLQASQTTATLTTFNEVNMLPIMDIRARYKEEFEHTHDGVRLGFMSFFVRSCTEALKRFPGVNASLDGHDIVYHGYQDIGVAVSSPRGLVVPVLRNADNMGLAKIEKEIREFGDKAKEGKLAIEDLAGGTFTISNGGVFGSLLSTPILNPPQTAILGMHKIQDRPMAVAGEVKILPMMYLALSYDHRIIDGKEAVQFLVTIKELLEDPTRLLLEI
jgi:2-oxoglutarate dehydrogenase E2 component (dihydrolipoamide succinyltransferase)